jgi:uncharacterized protein (DUF1810 family)
MGMQRFLEAQEDSYDTALREISDGCKMSHWMWYIFPQLKGLGRSYMADYYGLDGWKEAEAYWSEGTLRARLIEITTELLNHTDETATEIFGSIDAMKLRSCMTLFEKVTGEELFGKVLDAFFDGRRDEMTLRMLEDEASGR